MGNLDNRDNFDRPLGFKVCGFQNNIKSQSCIPVLVCAFILIFYPIIIEAPKSVYMRHAVKIPQLITPLAKILGEVCRVPVL